MSSQIKLLIRLQPTDKTQVDRFPQKKFALESEFELEPSSPAPAYDNSTGIATFNTEFHTVHIIFNDVYLDAMHWQFVMLLDPLGKRVMPQGNQYALTSSPQGATGGDATYIAIFAECEASGLSELTTLGHKLAESAVDITAYPIWTYEPSAAATSGRSSSTGTGPGALGQIAEGALRDVLGWKPDANKPEAFVNALNQVIQLRDVEGHTEWTWVPKSYAIQTDMGAVTGAQASIFNRAAVALDQCGPLLDGLYPLRADLPPDKLESIRAVIKAQLTQLVNEFGRLGGPRPQRVDALFKSLLHDTEVTNPEEIGTKVHAGLFFALWDRFGLDRRRVNTIEDEQNLTNYLILVDYVIGLAQSWHHQRSYFEVARGHQKVEPYLGTQLILLSRALDVVAEAVDDALFAMESVFLGPAERASIQLWSRDTALCVGDLLDWIERVAKSEGPELIKDGGKDGVVALASVLNELQQLTEAALVKPDGKQVTEYVSPAYCTSRVQLSIKALAAKLQEASVRALAIRASKPDGGLEERVLNHSEHIGQLGHDVKDYARRLASLESSERKKGLGKATK